jgi:phosphatidylinositol-3-phosphatase
VYYEDVTGDAAYCQSHDLPFTQLATDIADNDVPNYFFITPDTCHDGHDSPCASGTPSLPSCADGQPAPASVAGGLTSFDCWLSDALPPILTYLEAHDGLLLITADESDVNEPTADVGCCTGGPGGGPGFGGLVGLLALGPGVDAGYTSTSPYDHASLLRTTEDALGIGTYLNNAATASPMSDLFSPAVATPEAPLAIGLPLAGLLVAVAVGRRRRQLQRASTGRG